jgi:hypothetical protein
MLLYLKDASVDVRFNVSVKRVLMLGETAAACGVEMNLKIHFYGHFNL